MKSTNSGRPPLDVEQGAARVGLSRCRFRQLIKEGAIPAFRPGGRKLMVDPDDLDAFIESRKVASASATMPTPEVPR